MPRNAHTGLFYKILAVSQVNHVQFFEGLKNLEIITTGFGTENVIYQ